MYRLLIRSVNLLHSGLRVSARSEVTRARTSRRRPPYPCGCDPPLIRRVLDSAAQRKAHGVEGLCIVGHSGRVLAERLRARARQERAAAREDLHDTR